MIIESEFKPALWLKNPHLQTIWSSAFRKIPRTETLSERLELSDGDFIDLQWLNQSKVLDNDQNRPILLLLHGLEGSKESTYIRGLLNTLNPSDFRTVVMHFRGCGDELNRLPKSYHSGETEDLSQVIDILHSKYPQAKLAVAGFSLGGNVLLKYLGETSESSKIDVAMAISVPMLLATSAAKLDHGFSKLYRNRLIGELKNKISKKLAQHPNTLQLSQSQLSALQTFYDFDDQVTARLNGFSGADDYYERCSSRQFLKTIKTPTLILHSKDDPFMTEKVIPTNEELSEFVTLELTESGGHVGFVTGNNPWSLEFYIEKRLPAWITENLKGIETVDTKINGEDVQ